MNRKPWNEQDLEQLHLLYPDETASTIANKLCRPISSVYRMAAKLGLKKSEAFLNSEKSGRTRGQHSKSGQFAKGQTAWNKGKSMPTTGRTGETQFKKGHKPHNYKPIGSERMLDGYLQRKVTDTGYPPKDWVPVHRMLWEEHHGPLAADEVVTFINGDRLDIRLDNLKVLTRADLAVQNSIHNYPEELVSLIRLQAKVRRTIKKREAASHEE